LVPSLIDIHISEGRHNMSHIGAVVKVPIYINGFTITDSPATILGPEGEVIIHFIFCLVDKNTFPVLGPGTKQPPTPQQNIIPIIK
jgi:hypothetical protein